MFVINKSIVERKIHDTFFLIDISQNYLDDKCCLYEIDEIGDFIWQEIALKKDIEVIVDNLINNIAEDVAYSEVYADVKEFVGILEKEGFLEVVNGRD